MMARAGGGGCAGGGGGGDLSARGKRWAQARTEVITLWQYLKEYEKNRVIMWNASARHALT